MILRDLFRGIDNFREYTEILLENEYIADSIIKGWTRVGIKCFYN